MPAFLYEYYRYVPIPSFNAKTQVPHLHDRRRKKTTDARILVWKYAALFSTSFLIAVLVSAITEPLFELIHIKYALSAQNVIGTFLLDFVLTLLISLPEMKRICSPKYNHSMLRRGNGP